MLSIYNSVDLDTQKAARHTLNLLEHTLRKRQVQELYIWVMPEVQQTVAKLPVCVLKLLPEAMLLLSGAIWCFGD